MRGFRMSNCSAIIHSLRLRAPDNVGAFKEYTDPGIQCRPKINKVRLSRLFMPPKHSACRPILIQFSKVKAKIVACAIMENGQHLIGIKRSLSRLVIAEVESVV